MLNWCDAWVISFYQLRSLQYKNWSTGQTANIDLFLDWFLFEKKLDYFCKMNSFLVSLFLAVCFVAATRALPTNSTCVKEYERCDGQKLKCCHGMECHHPIDGIEPDFCRAPEPKCTKEHEQCYDATECCEGLQCTVVGHHGTHGDPVAVCTP